MAITSAEATVWHTRHRKKPTLLRSRRRDDESGEAVSFAVVSSSDEPRAVSKAHRLLYGMMWRQNADHEQKRETSDVTQLGTLDLAGPLI